MKLKGLIIICIVLLIVILGSLFYFSKTAKPKTTISNPNEEEGYEVENEEQVDDTSIYLVNNTRMTIKKIYLSDNSEDGSNKKWYDVYSEELLSGSDAIIAINNDDDEVKEWSIKIETEDNELEVDGKIKLEDIQDGQKYQLIYEDETVFVEVLNEDEKEYVVTDEETGEIEESTEIEEDSTEEDE